MKIVLLGAPGCGKGTQAVGISESFGIPHISTGDIFRSNIAAQTSIGVVAKSYIDKGQLVPDSVVIEIVRLRLSESDCDRGWILDGFPRTVAQAEALATFEEPDVVLDIEMPMKKLMARLTGRRICEDCGASYHIDSYSDLTCAKCRGKIVQRADDSPETVSRRLKVYESQTAPLIAYYQQKGNLRRVDGDQTVKEVANSIKSVLK